MEELKSETVSFQYSLKEDTSILNASYGLQDHLVALYLMFNLLSKMHKHKQDDASDLSI